MLALHYQFQTAVDLIFDETATILKNGNLHKIFVKYQVSFKNSRSLKCQQGVIFSTSIKFWIGLKQPSSFHSSRKRRNSMKTNSSSHFLLLYMDLKGVQQIVVTGSNKSLDYCLRLMLVVRSLLARRMKYLTGELVDQCFQIPSPYTLTSLINVHVRLFFLNDSPYKLLLETLSFKSLMIFRSLEIKKDPAKSLVMNCQFERQCLN